MSSRKKILAQVRKNKPPYNPLPSMEHFPNEAVDKVAYFKEVLGIIGGKAVELSEGEGLATSIQTYYPDKKVICSTVEGLEIATLDLANISDPHELKYVDLAVLQGTFAVAENGAIWVDEAQLHHRALGFITQHMVLVVRKSEMVWNMHEAYRRLEIQRPGYGVFIAGPSKTADIEQSLVIGAHGARSLMVFLV